MFREQQWRLQWSQTLPLATFDTRLVSDSHLDSAIGEVYTDLKEHRTPLRKTLPLGLDERGLRPPFFQADLE